MWRHLWQLELASPRKQSQWQWEWTCAVARYWGSRLVSQPVCMYRSLVGLHSTGNGTGTPQRIQLQLACGRRSEWRSE